jgi:hypothetical protein
MLLLRDGQDDGKDQVRVECHSASDKGDRVGTLTHVEKHEDSYAIVMVKDAKCHLTATLICNVYVPY